MKIKKIMNKGEVQSCTPETRLHIAAKVMRKANCGALPVVNRKNQVIGIVTDRDICLSLADKKKSPSRIRVDEVMTHNAVTVQANEEMSTALREMRTKKIGRLPVVGKSGKLKGIVSLHHLLSANVTDKNVFDGANGQGESVLGTVRALTDRYTGNKVKRRKKAS